MSELSANIYNFFPKIVHVYNDDQRDMRIEQMENFKIVLESTLGVIFTVIHAPLSTFNLATHKLEGTLIFNCHGGDHGIGSATNIKFTSADLQRKFNVTSLKPTFNVYFICCESDVYKNYKNCYGFQVDWRNGTFNERDTQNRRIHQVFRIMAESKGIRLAK